MFSRVNQQCVDLTLKIIRIVEYLEAFDRPQLVPTGDDSFPSVPRVFGSAYFYESMWWLYLDDVESVLPVCGHCAVAENVYHAMLTLDMKQVWI